MNEPELATEDEAVITNDDNALDIIDKLNELLVPHCLQIYDDGLVHDGFVVVTIVEVTDGVL